jgi:hypothetical protein
MENFQVTLCGSFAATIQPVPIIPANAAIFHCFFIGILLEHG